MSIKRMEVSSKDFKASNAEQLIKQYSPLINKLAYRFYSRYNSVLDFNDAKQEITICFYNCLLKYDGKKAAFVTYFTGAVKRLMSRYYYSYFHAIKINQNAVELKLDEEEESNRPTMDWLIHKGKETNPRRLYPLLSNKSQQLYNLFMNEGKIHPWLISQKLKISRCFAQKRYDAFKKELAIVSETRIY